MPIRNGKVAYRSPIETIWSDIEYDYVEQIEKMVLNAVQSVGIRVNKEELIKALAYDREQYRKGWEDRDSEIVRCKDCKHRCPDLDEGKMICLLDRSRRADDEEWFCADGKRKAAESE